MVDSESSRPTIVVAVDDSDASQTAAQEAAEMASRVDARLVLTHVVERRVTVTDADTGPIRESPDEAYANAEELMAAVSDRLEIDGVDVDIELLDGQPVSALVEYLEETDPLAVYIGHRALDNREEYLVGSFAKKLVGESPVPVTVVRKDSRH